MVAMYILLAVAGVSLVAHFLASSVAYFLLRHHVSLSEQLFSFPVQIPAKFGLLRLRYFFPFVRISAVASLAPRALPWLSVARYMGFLFFCTALAFIVVAFLVKPA